MKGGKKMVTIILAVAILAYAGWAIYEIRMKKKNGGCCNGSCGSCVSKNNKCLIGVSCTRNNMESCMILSSMIPC